MLKTIEVYLITGFLGSGKTACLNHIIKNMPADLKVMILMNEFGTIGIDGALVETADLNIVEINKGSIFCACAKTDFIQALADIAVNLRPDVLFIEATGVANPSDIRRDMRLPFFKGAFSFQKQICLVDLSNFMQEFKQFAAAEYQVKNADLCLLNKSDLSGPAEIQAVKELIIKHNPAVKFEETIFGRLDLARLLPKEPGRVQGEYPMQQNVTGQELEAVMRDVLRDPFAGLQPPDKLESAVYQWSGGNANEFMGLVQKWPPALVRVKALLKFIDGTKARFDWVLGELTFDKCLQDNHLHKNYENIWNRIMFLAEPAVMREFETMVLTEFKLTKVAE